MTYLSILAYGYAGSGKTALAVSSFRDWKARKPIRRGKWITLGREDNPALRVPEDARIRLTSPSLDNDDFVSEFAQWMRTIHSANNKAIAAGEPVPVEAVVVDGFSEFDILFEETFKRVHEEEHRRSKFRLWNELMTNFFSAIQILDPNELHCHVIVTARVTEKRRGIKDRDTQQVVGGDPDYMDFDYYPNVKGGFKDHFPNYFQIVTYLDTDVGITEIGGKKVRAPKHQAHLVRTGDYLVKNNWEYDWLKAGHPDMLVNASFDDILAIIESLDSEGESE